MQMINFLVLLFVLNHILYKPIMRILDERKKRIYDATEECRRLDQSCEERLKLYQEQIQAAKIKAMMQKEEIRAEGMESAKRLIEGVKEEADRIITQAMERIEKEAGIAREALRRQTREMAVEIAEKLIGRNLQ